VPNWRYPMEEIPVCDPFMRAPLSHEGPPQGQAEGGYPDWLRWLVHNGKIIGHGHKTAGCQQGSCQILQRAMMEPWKMPGACGIGVAESVLYTTLSPCAMLQAAPFCSTAFARSLWRNTDPLWGLRRICCAKRGGRSTGTAGRGMYPADA